MAVQCESNETVAISCIVWRSKGFRDSAMQQTGDDKRLDPKFNPMPFDGARMISGSFDVIVET